MQFEKFQKSVSKQFAAMSGSDLFRTAANGDDMWTAYLAAFPPGSDPVLRKRTEHNCSCCRHFIRTMGNVVAIVDGAPVSIWDGAVGDAAYDAVSSAMSAFVKAQPIADVFLHYERVVGVEKNFQDDDGRVLTWNHFCAAIPVRNERNFICAKVDIPTKLGEQRASHDVLSRSLTEITQGAIDDVLALMTENTLYRGLEYKAPVEAFARMKREFDALPEAKRDAFVWSRLSGAYASVARIRNTAIGTLLVDLSEGKDLNRAVSSYEAKVAPANYKRPASLVTQSMVDAAKKTIAELGLTSALERRYAVLGDISVNNVIFADRQSRALMRDALFDGVATKPRSSKNVDDAQTVGIEEFIRDVVPRVSSVEAMFDSTHVGNLVSLIAPADPHALNMFKWGNRFSWSYNGEVTDSIKEKVKAAGGSVTGELCCRLAWRNFDDLDFHMAEPGYEIYYINRSSRSPSGGMLDVDMNAGRGVTREPVENIFYPHLRTMKSGAYKLFVHQYQMRESSNVGFEVEIDFRGVVYRMAYDKPVRDRITVATFAVRNGVVTMEPELPTSAAAKTLWGVKTGEFHRVSALMFSPNYWDAQRGVGNQHYFFMLDGCKNDGQARGFYNEFLRSELDKHRKVIEIVGSRAKVPPSDAQLSGLGFSSTLRNEVLVRVQGDLTRTLKIAF
jgi:hypothetical protein